jgi:hypothetical protein
MATVESPTKHPDISETKAADVEVEDAQQDPKAWLYQSDRSELTELTPVEAFKWNVEGDQSPCRFTQKFRELILILRSS